MQMTYEEKARCPLCQTKLGIMERKMLPNVGSVLVCRCPRCGHLESFSEEKVSGSAKSCAERLRENSPDDRKEASNHG
jgi:C4-type Zn-finger protein